MTTESHSKHKPLRIPSLTAQCQTVGYEMTAPDTRLKFPIVFRTLFLFAAAVVGVTGCVDGGPSAPVTLRWDESRPREEAIRAIADMSPEYIDIVAFDDKFWAAGLSNRLETIGDPVLASSGDGDTWRRLPLPEKLSGLAQSPLAATSDWVYLLGTAGGSPSVWRTSNGSEWELVGMPTPPLPTAPLAVTAGPRGLMIVATDKSTRTQSLTWSSTAGGGFIGPRVGPRISDSSTRILTASSSGFMLCGGVGKVFCATTEDGKAWTDIGKGLESVSFLGPAESNGRIRIAFGYTSPQSGSVGSPSRSKLKACTRTISKSLRRGGSAPIALTPDGYRMLEYHR